MSSVSSSGSSGDVVAAGYTSLMMAPGHATQCGCSRGLFVGGLVMGAALAVAAVCALALEPRSVYYDSPRLLQAEQGVYAPAAGLWRDTAVVVANPPVANVYRVPRAPRLRAGNLTVLHVAYPPETLDSGYYDTKEFTLAPGSTVSWNATTTSDASVLHVIRGMREYQRFATDAAGWLELLRETGRAFAGSINATLADSYFFVVVSKAPSTTISWQFVLHKTYFDVSEATGGAALVCSALPVCPVALGTRDALLVEVPAGSQSLIAGVDVGVSVPLRKMLYWCVVTPLIAINAVVACASFGFVMRRRRRQLLSLRASTNSDSPAGSPSPSPHPTT